MAAQHDDLLECARCGALNPPRRRQCAECSAELVALSADVEWDEERERGERALRRRTVTRAKNALMGIRGLYWVYGVGLGIAALKRIIGGATDLTWELAVLSVAATAGALLLYRFPRAITVGIAALHSVATAWFAVAFGDDRLGRMVQMAFALWIAVPIVFKASQLAAEDEYSARRLAGRFRTSAAPSEARDRAASRRLAETRVANRTWTLIIVGAVGAAVLGLGGYLFATRPAPVGPIKGSLTRWQSALESGDLPAAEALCTEQYRVRWPKIVKILEREGWASGMEIAPPHEYRSGETFYEIHFDLPRGQMKTIWTAEDGEWRASRVVMSRVRAR